MRKQKKLTLVLGIITVFLATTLFLLSHIVPASERFELVLDGKAVLERTWASACAYCLNEEVGGREG